METMINDHCKIDQSQIYLDCRKPVFETRRHVTHRERIDLRSSALTLVDFSSNEYSEMPNVYEIGGTMMIARQQPITIARTGVYAKGLINAIVLCQILRGARRKIISVPSKGRATETLTKNNNNPGCIDPTRSRSHVRACRVY